MQASFLTCLCLHLGPCLQNPLRYQAQSFCCSSAATCLFYPPGKHKQEGKEGKGGKEGKEGKREGGKEGKREGGKEGRRKGGKEGRGKNKQEGRRDRMG